jgi:ATP-dependent RNA helicase DDX52/ROK1
MQSIPIILGKRDLLACAPTGSGKTLAYLIPLLMRLKTHMSKGFRAVIITPTRELAQQVPHFYITLTQVDNEVKKLAKGRNFKMCLLTKQRVERFKENEDSRRKYDILISTPMRLVHAINEKCLELDKYVIFSDTADGSVKYLVLDEADKLFELGLLEQTDEIIAACTSKRVHKALFSATIPAAVEELARSVMTDPLRVIIGTKYLDLDSEY